MGGSVAEFAKRSEKYIILRGEAPQITSKVTPNGGED